MSPTQALCRFLAELTYSQLPEPVLARTEELYLDWLASALASQGAHPIPCLNATRRRWARAAARPR